jgi:hypothetical protein
MYESVIIQETPPEYKINFLFKYFLVAVGRLYQRDWQVIRIKIK